MKFSPSLQRGVKVATQVKAVKPWTGFDLRQLQAIE
jgi:hypothetical protein